MKKIQKEYSAYLALSFVGGFLVMMLEMCAFRVLSTNFGSSIFVTGTLLTLIMTALSAGYYVGGRLSKSKQPQLILIRLLCVCMVYVFFINLVLSNWIVNLTFSLWSYLSSGTLAHEILPPLITGLALYGIPMFILAQVSPFIIQMVCAPRGKDSGHQVGSYSGSIMAVSTIGSIGGTLLTSYGFLPFMGLRNTLYCSLILLLGVILLSSFILKITPKLLTTFSLGALFIIGAYLDFVVLVPPAEAELRYEAETSYGSIKLYERSKADGEKYLEYRPSKYYIDSILYPDAPLRSQFHLSYLVPSLVYKAESFLILGTAGGAAVRQIQALNKNAKITAIELDGKVIDMSKNYFGLVPSDKLTIINSDAKSFLASTQEKYDYIVGDLFAGEFIPPHCITQEFFTLAYNHLNPDGILYLNSNMFDFQYGSPDKLGVFSPLHHLESTLFHSGFVSMFEGAFFHGIYAFKREVPEAEIVGKMRAKFNDPKTDDDIKVALATTLLRLIPVPKERAAAEPYTSDWTPENLIQAKSNFRNFERSLYQRMSEASWAAEEASWIPSPLGQLSAHSLYDSWKTSHHVEGLPFARVPNCDQYLASASDILAKEKRFSRTELARYFLLGCDFETKLSSHSSSESIFIYAYNEGLYFARHDYNRDALPLLTYVLNNIFD